MQGGVQSSGWALYWFMNRVNAEAGMLLLFALLGTALVLLAANWLLPGLTARAAMALERKRSGLVARHASLPYLEGGNGQEVLLLLHGFAGDKDNFTRIARYLTPHYHVIIPDLPGFGEAGRDPVAAYDVAAQVEHVRAFMAERAIARFHLGGYSMGGNIAAEYAARHADQVKSLWLLAPGGTDAALTVPEFQRYLAGGPPPFLVRQRGDFAKLMAACMARPPFFPYCLRHTLERRALADAALHGAILRQLVDSPRLHGPIAAPALIVWGTADRILSPAGAPAIAALMPNSRVLLMEGIGHLPIMEAPRRTARDFLDFQLRRDVPSARRHGYA